MKTSILFLLNLISILAVAQVNDNSWKEMLQDGANFYSIKNNFEAYVRQEYEDSIPKSKLSNIKDYYRFVDFWKPRIGITNNATNYSDYFANLNSSTGYCTSTDMANWELLGPSQYTSQYMGLVQQVLYESRYSNSNILSSEHGGIWKQQSNGNSWKNVTDNLRLPGISATEIIRNPFNADHLIASTASGIHFMVHNYGQGIIQSFDNGSNWSVMQEFPSSDYPSIMKIIADPNDTYPTDGLTLYAIGKKTLYKSTNTGNTWTTVNNLPVFNAHSYLLDIEIADNGDIFLSTFCPYNNTDGQIFKSHNGAWSDISVLFPDFQRMKLTKPFNGKIFCFIDASDGKRKVFKTIDYGFTWQLLALPNIPYIIGPGEKKEIEYSPASGIVYLGILDLVFFKEDDLSTIKNIEPGHVDIRDIEFMGIDANGFENLLVATDGGISQVKVKTTDISVNNYINLNGNHLPIEEFVGLGISHDKSNFIVAGAVHNNSFKYNNGSWNKFYGGDGGDCEVNWDNPSIYYYQGNESMTNSTNSFNFYNCGWFIGMEYELNPKDPYVLYAGRGTCGGSAKLLIFNEKRTPNGSSSLAIKNAPIGMSQVGAIGVNTNNVIFIADYSGSDETTPNRFAKSINNGDTWIDLSNKLVYKKVSGGSWQVHSSLGVLLAWKAIEDIVCMPDNPDEMYISIGGSLSPGNSGFMRVLQSQDGGESWYDYSENLPPFPVMALEYQKGSLHRIFAGTDAGVYYRDPTTNDRWQCFSSGLPPCIITDLDYDPCSRYLYASTYGRSIFKTYVPFNEWDYIQALPTNSNILWDKPVELVHDIAVPENTTLTITSNVYIMKGKKIMIHPKGKLIINGGKLTNSCGEYWQGIQVWGNKNASQFPDANGNYQQGYLELNNATIENAVCAVDLWKPNDYSKTGGILIATNSTFRNNANSIHALHYKNMHPYHPTWEMSYFGRVQNCTFEITTGYIPTNTFYKHVDLANIKGFSFSGSDFTLAPNVVGVSDWNQGIAAYSAGFSVQATCTSPTQPCSSYDKCKFTGFRYGIFVNDALFSTNTFTVNRAEFENNIYGINVIGIKNETILNSDFKVGYNTTPGCPAVSGYGIYLDNSKGFAIEENTFIKMPNAPVANYTGIQVNNSLGQDDIYKNSFTGLSFGNYAHWQNWTENAGIGLEYLCNANQSNWADFFIPLPQVNGNTIQTWQGNTLTSAGNTFSQTNNTWHFYNDGGIPLTHFYNGSSPLEPDASKLWRVAKSASNTANQCPSHYGGNGTVSSIVLNAQDKLLRENQYAYNLVNYNNVKTLHDQMRDGGSTQERVSDIETAQPQDMWALRSELLGASPHLTEEVLRKVADKTNVFTESVIFDILAANPDELKKEELLQYLENKENPLPEYMIDILRQVAAGETYRTVLEKQMSMYRKEMTRAANDMIRSYLNDSVTDYNALRGWLDNLGGMEADKQIIAIYVQEGNFTQATSLANMLPTLYNLTGDELVEHNRYMEMLNLYQTLQTENRHFDELTTNEKATLEDYANNSSGSAGAAAKGILSTYYNAQFVDCMQSIEPASLKKGTVSPEDMAKVYGMEISVKPNPASAWAAFDYILPDMDVTATLQITDMTGKIIETFTLTGKQGQMLWDTRQVKAGVYLYTMKSGIKSLSGKITIIK